MEKLEAQHGINIAGTQAVDIDHVAINDVFGDFVYFGPSPARNGQPAVFSGGRVHDSTMVRNGRQGIAITGGKGIQIDHNTIGDTRRATFDLEPNEGAGWGIDGVTITDNEIGPGGAQPAVDGRRRPGARHPPRRQHPPPGDDGRHPRLGHRERDPVCSSPTTSPTAAEGLAGERAVIRVEGVDDVTVARNAQPLPGGAWQRGRVVGQHERRTRDGQLVRVRRRGHRGPRRAPPRSRRAATSSSPAAPSTATARAPPTDRAAGHGRHRATRDPLIGHGHLGNPGDAAGRPAARRAFPVVCDQAIGSDGRGRSAPLRPCDRERCRTRPAAPRRASDSPRPGCSSSARNVVALHTRDEAVALLRVEKLDCTCSHELLFRHVWPIPVIGQRHNLRSWNDPSPRNRAWEPTIRGYRPRRRATPASRSWFARAR